LSSKHKANQRTRFYGPKTGRNDRRTERVQQFSQSCIIFSEYECVFAIYKVCRRRRSSRHRPPGSGKWRAGCTCPTFVSLRLTRKSSRSLFIYKNIECVATLYCNFAQQSDRRAKGNGSNYLLKRRVENRNGLDPKIIFKIK
jgi:hypothetical protein